jgi:uncharacterized protein with HEPN domain
MFIFDIIVAILKIEKVSSKFDNPQDLLYSFTDWDSVIREFEIIGEASKYLLKDKLLETYHREVVDFRNFITHNYFGIDEEEVWEIIYSDLTTFKEVIIKIIKDLDPKEKNQLIDDFIEDNKYLDFVVKFLEKLKGE